ncbi:MAG: Na+/H+ antiporter NhaC family protein, partial [Bacteroidales bacterium]|nr:Na+/H+ antiporter NhaC family protein [Bacteroidales bacterium]
MLNKKAPYSIASLILLLFISLSNFTYAQEMNNQWSIEKPLIIMSGIEVELEISIPDTLNSLSILVNGDELILDVDDGIAHFPLVIDEELLLIVESQYGIIEIDADPIPMWFSIIPPLIAILVALIFKEVFTALFTGIFIGTFTIFYYHGLSFFGALLKGFLSIIDDYIIKALNNTGHLSIIIFSMLIGGMVHIITKNGGMKGVVNYLGSYAKTKKSGQFITWLMGISIFFDDYANTLVVGNTMRPVTDRLKISREKLAYLVDSTAAPIASIALITTWVGAELSYIQDGIKLLNLNETPYIVFLHSLKYAFYPIFTLGFILILIFTGRDFGPMKKAEEKAANCKENTDQALNNNPNTDYQPKKGIKPKAFNAIIPVLVVIFGTILGLIITGLDSVSWDSNLSFYRNMSEVIGNADSYIALLWSSLAATFVAVLLSISQNLLSLKESMESMVEGFRLMLTAVLILTLAWALAALTEDIHTAEFISNSMIYLNLSPYFVPGIAFLLAALVAFSTGSSWGTMAILYPLMLPAVWLLSKEAGLNYEDSLSIFHNVVSVILAGSVLGDHCSPISDTTIMSSLASQCNHIDHVRTQLPYALAVGLVSLLIGTIPTAFGWP